MQANISVVFQYSKRVSTISIIYNPIIKYENIINILVVSIKDFSILYILYFNVMFNGVLRGVEHR